MRSSRENRRVTSADTYELCIDLMVDSQRTIDKINLMIGQLEGKAISENDPEHPIVVNELKQYHSNLQSLKEFISEYLQERIESFK